MLSTSFTQSFNVFDPSGATKWLLSSSNGGTTFFVVVVVVVVATACFLEEVVVVDGGGISRTIGSAVFNQSLKDPFHGLGIESRVEMEVCIPHSKR